MSARILPLAGLCLLICVSASADSVSPTAIARYAALKTKLVGEKGAGDWTAFRGTAQTYSTFLHGSPSSLLELARADLNLGDPGRAKPYVDAFLAMGQAHPVLDTPLFAPLMKDLSARLAQNSAPVALASPVFAFQDASLIAEDIDYDSVAQRFFVTTVRGQEILALHVGAHEHVFATAPDHWPLLAVKVDSRRRRLWASEVALERFASVPKSDQGRSAVLEYGIDSGKLLGRFEPPQKCALGDMVLDTHGDPVIADNTGGRIWQLRKGQFRRIDRGDFISPQTSAVDGNNLLVPDYLRGIGRLDPSTGTVRWLDMQNRFALNGIDGLYLQGDRITAVQNGAMPERVVEWTLDPAHTKIVDETIIERATPSLGDPTHGVFVRDDFYYLANSGWDKLGDGGTPAQGAILTPARIMRLRL